MKRIQIFLLFFSLFFLCSCLATKELNGLNKMGSKQKETIESIEGLVLKSYSEGINKAEKNGHNIKPSHLNMALTCEIETNKEAQSINLKITIFKDTEKKNMVLAITKEWPEFYKSDPQEVKKIIDSMVELVIDYLMASS